MPLLPTPYAPRQEIKWREGPYFRMMGNPANNFDGWRLQHLPLTIIPWLSKYARAVRVKKWIFRNGNRTPLLQ